MNVRDTLFCRAARREPVERTPVWFMRQAGRVLPEYRAVREGRTLLEITQVPELCAEVTLQPVARFDVDAAVLFADIVSPLVAIGVDVTLVDDVGPVVGHPIRANADLEALRPIEPGQDVPHVLETIRIVDRELGGRIPVIGFAGAPFTLAAYLVEGRPSRDFRHTKAMMYSAPALWHALMERLTAIIIPYLRAQAEAGAGALQLFDSWVGALSPQDYAEFVQPYARRIFGELRAAGVPLIHFGTNTATLLDAMKTDGAGVIGVDWRIPLDRAWAQVGHSLGIQGNLDPMALCGSPEHLKGAIADVLRRAGGRPGHIFNLGHGLHPATPVEQVQRTVEWVRELGARADAPLASAAAR
ncbi:MAG TPA: uroporphyrinogen decarboxylase [Gemmatimonadales bacterium]|nr:uroporphyrinogen decarboxylase [Gemmatimonadales bacterium]